MGNSFKNQIQSNDRIQRLSIKDFLVFSLFLYPIGFFLLISQGELINFFHSRFVFVIISLVLFSVINYIWGQLKIRPILLILSCSIGLFFSLKQISNGFIDFTPDALTTLLGAVIVYFGMFLVFQFLQFLTWVPFIIKFIWQNRETLDELPFH